MPRYNYSKEDDRWIIENYPKMTAGEMAIHFGISKVAMRQKIFRLQKEVGKEVLPPKEGCPIGTIKMYKQHGEIREYIKTENGFVIQELIRLNGKNPIISTNVPLRNDGLPYSNYEKRIIIDKVVAVYFTLKNKQVVLACDKWHPDVPGGSHEKFVELGRATEQAKQLLGE